MIELAGDSDFIALPTRHFKAEGDITVSSFLVSMDMTSRSVHVQNQEGEALSSLEMPEACIEARLVPAPA